MISIVLWQMIVVVDLVSVNKQPFEVRFELLILNVELKVQHIRHQVLVFVRKFDVKYPQFVDHVYVPEVDVLPVLRGQEQTGVDQRLPVDVNNLQLRLLSAEVSIQIFLQQNPVFKRGDREL